MNKKGQALIEFVILIPVFVLLVLGVIEFGNLIYQKYQLENHLDYIVDLYKEQNIDTINQYIKKNKLEIVYQEEHDSYIDIKVSKNIQINAPIVSNILGKNYTVEASRSIVHEES